MRKMEPIKNNIFAPERQIYGCDALNSSQQCKLRAHKLTSSEISLQTMPLPNYACPP